MRPLPLTKRRLTLQRLLEKADIPELHFSDSHEDPVALLERLDKIGLEGIVSKLKAQKYISGKNWSWIKVKCHTWRKANSDRKELFARKR